MRNVFRFLSNTEGATAIEYAFLASLIAIVIITAVTAVGTSVTGVFTSVASSLK
jgi:pilus assembly protein Flp/PilA